MHMLAPRILSILSASVIVEQARHNVEHAFLPKDVHWLVLPALWAIPVPRMHIFTLLVFDLYLCLASIIVHLLSSKKQGVGTCERLTLLSEKVTKGNLPSLFPLYSFAPLVSDGSVVFLTFFSSIPCIHES